MMQKTTIEWTNWTTTPLKMQMPDGSLVNACVHHSVGCQKCYAESYVRRFWKKAWGEFPGYTKALLKIGKPFFVEKELQAVLKLSANIKAGKANPEENRIFWNDMTDEFLEFWPDEFRDRLFAVRAMTPNLVHQVLTKRAERMQAYLSADFLYQRLHEAIKARMGYDNPQRPAINRCDLPFENVWLGVSVENKKHGLPRIGHLQRTPAAVRFLSVEPLLEDLGDLRMNDCRLPEDCYTFAERISWVIVGCESGHGHRPMQTEWAESIADQCKDAGVAFFMKQMVVNGKVTGKIEDFPERLRVREMPGPREAVKQ